MTDATPTPIVLSLRAEQELRAMAAMLGLSLEEIYAQFRKQHWIVPAGAIDVRAHRHLADSPGRRSVIESPSGHLEDMLYESLAGRFHARGWHDHIPRPKF